MKVRKRMNPLQRVNWFLGLIRAKGKVATATPIIQMRSLFNISGDSTAIGFNMAVIPNTDAILNMLDPIKFPREMAFSPLMIDMTDAASSGTLVPTAMIETDITR